MTRYLCWPLVILVHPSLVLQSTHEFWKSGEGRRGENPTIVFRLRLVMRRFWNWCEKE
jgi:hypothetical protein